MKPIIVTMSKGKERHGPMPYQRYWSRGIIRIPDGVTALISLRPYGSFGMVAERIQLHPTKALTALPRIVKVRPVEW